LIALRPRYREVQEVEILKSRCDFLQHGVLLNLLDELTIVLTFENCRQLEEQKSVGCQQGAQTQRLTRVRAAAAEEEEEEEEG
jgi:hypothetical protein